MSTKNTKNTTIQTEMLNRKKKDIIKKRKKEKRREKARERNEPIYTGGQLLAH